MMTIAPLGKYDTGGTAQGRVDYLLGQVIPTQTDYYLNGTGKDGEAGGGEPAGRWFGAGARDIGLSGSVMPHALHGLMQGYDPRTFDPKAKDNAGLVDTPGSGRRSGWDCCFVCPKSVSVAFALETPANREVLRQTFHAAVNAALARLERDALTRRGHAGKDAEPVEGIVAAVFEHGTARVPDMKDRRGLEHIAHLLDGTADPHLHAHAIVSNVCLRKDGTWGSLVNDSLFRDQKLLGAIFRAELARGLHERLGYAIREGVSDTFELAGLDPKILDHFSKRHVVIKEWLSVHRDELARKGITGDAAEQYAWARTRKVKESVNRPALFEEWQADASRTWDVDARSLDGIKGRLTGLMNPPPDLSVDALLAKVSGGESVFELGRIEAELWKARQFRDVDVQATLRELIDGERLVLLRDDKGRLYGATRELFEKEQEIARLTVDGRHDTGHRTDAVLTRRVVDDFATASRAKAEREGWRFDERIWTKQRTAIESLTTETGRIAVLKGFAGAGKTTAMTCVRQVYEASGFTVIGCAVAGRAAENLEREAGIKSDTLLGLLTRIEHGHLRLGRKDIVVADEAGMIDSALMHRLVKACDASGAKLLTLGEAEQLQPVGGGGAFGMMERLLAERESDSGGVQVLGDITRQKGECRWLTQAILDIRNGDAESGLQALQDHNLLRTGENGEVLKERMVRDWMTSPVGYRKKLMIAGTRAEVSDLNALARASRRARGELVGEDVRLDVRPRDGEATMQKAFAVGDRIAFGKKDRHLGIGGEGVQNGCYGTIEKLDKRLLGRSAVLTVRLDDGRRIVFDTGMQVKLAPKHERKKGKVLAFTRYNFIDHAYAITVHKSQGQTVENCFVLASDRMSDREWGYVALSWSKGATALYATKSQREGLADNLSRSRMKGTSLDYERVDKEVLRGAEASLDVEAVMAGARGGRRDMKQKQRGGAERECEIE